MCLYRGDEGLPTGSQDRFKLSVASLEDRTGAAQQQLQKRPCAEEGLSAVLGLIAVIGVHINSL